MPNFKKILFKKDNNLLNNIFTKLVLILLLSNNISTNVYPKPIAQAKIKFLGNVYSTNQMTNFQLYWNQVTPENGGKWGSVEYSRDQMNWGEASSAYNFAKSHGFKFRYHILVWGNQQPGWIEALDSTAQLEEIEEWFAAVAEKFPAIDYLEVVNEPLHDPPTSGNGGYINALGGSNSLYGTGWDWIIKAFELARQYFPDSTKLMINEYSIVNSSSNTAKYLEIINLLLERDLIDGIGVQAHAFSTKGTSTSTIKTNLDALAETGLPIQICEMDVDGTDDQIQLEEYRRIFPIFWEHPAIEGITLWGWRYGLWRESTGAYLVDDRGAPRPSLEWLRSYVENPPPNIPEIVSPKNETGIARNPLLVWHPSDSARSYHVEISANSIFSTIVKDTTLSDTSLQIVTPLNSNFRYYWHVSALNDYNESSFFPFSYFVTNDGITDVFEKQLISEEVKLYQNYPNPFNPTTTIAFNLFKSEEVHIDLYDELGRKILQVDNKYYNSGFHEINFDASNLPSGVYFYQLKAGDFVSMKKLMLLK